MSDDEKARAWPHIERQLGAAHALARIGERIGERPAVNVPVARPIPTRSAPTLLVAAPMSAAPDPPAGSPTGQRKRRVIELSMPAGSSVIAPPANAPRGENIVYRITVQAGASVRFDIASDSGGSTVRVDGIASNVAGGGGDVASLVAGKRCKIYIARNVTALTAHECDVEIGGSVQQIHARGGTQRVRGTIGMQTGTGVVVNHFG